MTDTPQHIRDLQLELWLKRSPADRLRQCIEDSDAFYRFVENVKPSAGAKEKVIIKINNDNHESKQG